MHKKNKIRLILLEGESDRLFFNSFKSKFARELLDISLLKGQNQNFKKIRKEIEISQKIFKYKAVWLVIDLNTQAIGTRRYYTSKNELLKEYAEKLGGRNIPEMVIMVRDLECWCLLYFDKHKNTEKLKDAESILRRLMNIKGITSKPQIVQRLLKKPDFWNKLKDNKSKNGSFKDFIDRIDKIKGQE